MSLLSTFALLSIALGFFLQRRHILRPDWLLVVSRILIQGIYPCLIFSSLLTRYQWNDIRRLWVMPLSVFLLLLAGLVYGRLLQNRVADEKQRRSFVFLAIMPNYSFVPLVIAEAFFRESGIALVALTSLGADIFLWTLAFPEITRRGRPQWRQLGSPPLLSLLLALVLIRFRSEINLPLDGVIPVLAAIGKLTIPLSMFLLGSHLARAAGETQDRGAHKLLLGWRLILAPALMFLVLCFMHLPFEEAWVLILVASMPGAIVSVVLSELHEASASFASYQVMIGHLLWIVTGPAWLWLAHTFLQ